MPSLPAVPRVISPIFPAVKAGKILKDGSYGRVKSVGNYKNIDNASWANDLQSVRLLIVQQ